MSKLLKRNGIEIYCTQNTPKSCIAERFILTLRNMIEKYYVISHSTVWLYALPKLIEEYNHRYHRSIGMSPIEARLKKNYKRVYKKLYGTTIDQNTEYMSNGICVFVYLWIHVFMYFHLTIYHAKWILSEISSIIYMSIQDKTRQDISISIIHIFFKTFSSLQYIEHYLNEIIIIYYIHYYIKIKIFVASSVRRFLSQRLDIYIS